MKFKLTQADIDNGKCGNPDQCPVALLLNRELPGKRVSVGHTSIVTDDEMYKQPSDVHEWIMRFDAGWKNLPLIEFDLPILKQQ